MKNQKPHHRQVSYHAYTTYIQAINQAIKDQKSIQKGIKIPKVNKKYTNIEILHKNRKSFIKLCAKAHMTFQPTPKSHNVLIRRRGATTGTKTHKNTKYRKVLNEAHICTS